MTMDFFCNSTIWQRPDPAPWLVRGQVPTFLLGGGHFLFFLFFFGGGGGSDVPHSVSRPNTSAKRIHVSFTFVAASAASTGLRKSELVTQMALPRSAGQEERKKRRSRTVNGHLPGLHKLDKFRKIFCLEFLLGLELIWRRDVDGTSEEASRMLLLNVPRSSW